MSLRKDLADMLAAAGVDDVDVDRAEQDEHVRYEAYLRILRAVATPADRDVVQRILQDPDQVMAEAAVVRHIDRMAEEFDSPTSFGAWAETMRPLVGEQEFLQRRIAEWTMYRAVMDGATPETEQIRDSSDWLQRKLTADVPSGPVLDILAEVGRTKRVRNTAKSKARNKK